jgi:hypothetical protein
VQHLSTEERAELQAHIQKLDAGLAATAQVRLHAITPVHGQLHRARALHAPGAQRRDAMHRTATDCMA